MLTFHRQDSFVRKGNRAAPAAEASGIADQDGLDEQVPFRDWSMVGMV
jgi:hypothetical protein